MQTKAKEKMDSICKWGLVAALAVAIMLFFERVPWFTWLFFVFFVAIGYFSLRFALNNEIKKRGHRNRR